MDPRLTLAISLHANPGVYALFLGSGVSRAAGVPTGWEITLDLIEKVAIASGEDTGGDPEAWYLDKFGEAPNYSLLLEQVGRTKAERQQLLRQYFEPTEEEREEGLKLPTRAHHAIAEIVAKGCVRVIVTTNFDRLLEQALEARGVVPAIISSADSAEGARPLIHSACTILKIHGDYMDDRILNTPDELATYPDAIVRLLDTVFDEFGLVVCGWSAEWDEALRKALQRCASRRYTTFWTTRSAPSDTARRLIEHRDAQLIEIEGADEFFVKIGETIQSLEGSSRPHPLSVQTAVATAKRYLSDSTHRIRLHDLVMDEVEELRGKVMNADRFPLTEPFSDEELLTRVTAYEGMSEILQGLVITGCFWDEGAYRKLWINALERLACIDNVSGPSRDVWKNLMRYPALLVTYSGCLAAMAADQYTTVHALLTEAHARNSEASSFVLRLYPWAVLDDDVAKRLPGMEKRLAPVNDWLFDRLREPLRQQVPDDALYAGYFDLFEYLLGLTYVDLHAGDELGSDESGEWAPVGRFRWRWAEYRRGQFIKLTEEIERLQEAWPPIRAGFFGGSYDRCISVKNAFDAFWLRLPRS